MEDIVVVGYGGHARSVADSIERQGIYNIIGYTDVHENYSPYKYLGTDINLPRIYDAGVHFAAVGVGFLGKGTLRNRLYKELSSIGFKLPSIIDPSAIVSCTATIGDGTFIGKYAVINSNASVGKMCIINTAAIVEHDCNIAEYTHIAVNATLCGGAQVGRECLVGAGSVVIQEIEIDDNSIVGAGSIVYKNIEKNSLWINGRD